ncbi:hypothetical protein QOT17_025040 [Balamuthia mandrillaris]
MVPFIPLTNRTVYQPEQSEMSVSFPNNNKPDHTLTLHDPQDNHPLANYSVTALFATLMEVDQEGETVSRVSLQDTDFVMEELGNTSFNLNHALPFISFSADISSFTSVGTGKKVNLTANMKMEVNFTMFAEEQVIEFADVEQVMAANTLKWSLFLSSWPFQHRNHSLQLHLSLSSQDGPIAEGVEEVEENGVFSFVLRTENTEIPFNVLPLALHGAQGERVEVRAGWRGQEQEMVVQLPSFEHSLLLDPDMSLLVGDAEEEGKEKDETDGLWWKIVVPVVVVLVVAVVVVIAVVGVTMLKRRSKQRRVKVANKPTEHKAFSFRHRMLRSRGRSKDDEDEEPWWQYPHIETEKPPQKEAIGETRMLPACARSYAGRKSYTVIPPFLAAEREVKLQGMVANGHVFNVKHRPWPIVLETGQKETKNQPEIGMDINGVSFQRN